MSMEFNWKNIVGSVVRNAKRFNNARTSRSTYWFIVAELCGIGSTSAHELCRLFGVDPHEKLPQSDVDEIARKCNAEMEDGEQSPVETCCKMMAHVEEKIAR